MAGDELYDKRRGQRMLLTKWIGIYNSTDDEGERERAARKLADVLAWAKSVGISPAEIAEVATCRTALWNCLKQARELVRQPMMSSYAMP